METKQCYYGSPQTNKLKKKKPKKEKKKKLLINGP